MLTRIGSPAPAQDAVSLLLDCHERIRSFLAMAHRLGESSAAEGGEVRDAAARVHRYFTEALPLHAQDEEESIVPRLRGLDPQVDAALAVMSREHLEHEPPLTALVAACAELAQDPARIAALAPTVLRATEELERHFAAHLRGEEELIFPALRRLPPSAQDEVVREMRARRG